MNDKVNSLIKLNLPSLEGIRVIGTYRCNKGCSFCYQSTKDSVDLNLESLRSLCSCVCFSGFKPRYITFQGGEITIASNSLQYYDIVDYYFPSVYRKSITTNGMADISYYRECKMHGITNFTFSMNTSNNKPFNTLLDLSKDGFFTVRLNVFLSSELSNKETIKEIYEICFFNNIPITFCCDMLSSFDNPENYILNMLGLDKLRIDHYKSYSIVRDYEHSFVFWIYKHENNYDNDNLIILPNGDVTVDFNEVITCMGAK